MTKSKLTKIGYSLRDVAILQAPISFINHRAEVNPKVNICGREVYPIFVAPMSCVTDQENYEGWINEGVTPVIPRSVQVSENNKYGITFEERVRLSKSTFVSFSLAEAQKLLEDDYDCRYICIDLAQGAMFSLYTVCQALKGKYGVKIEIMTGNIANSKTYYEYCNNGIDWVRCNVGTGNRCTSSCNLGLHMPSATLLDEINSIRQEIRSDFSLHKAANSIFTETKVICDGGINNFDDINKALALGADAVMTGKIFAQSEEACGQLYYAKCLEDIIEGGEYYDGDVFHDIIAYGKPPFDDLRGYKPFRAYYGMSTRIAQKETGGSGTKTAEGISKPVAVEYPIKKWLNNFDSYLRSVMSYCNSKNLEDFHNKAELIILGGTGDLSYRK